MAAKVSPRPLAADAVHVWRLDLDVAPADAAASADEERRAGRMLDEQRRARFLASRAWLRVILGIHLGVDPAAVAYTVSQGGKPSVVGGGDLGFSLSRSAEVALVAVTRGRAVGVDVERLQAGVDHDRLAEQFFTPAEAAALRELPEADRRDAFFGLWVRKEAVVKASGAGLTDEISHLDVRADTVAGRWTVTSLDAGRGFAAAVAADGPLGPISMRDWALRG